MRSGKEGDEHARSTEGGGHRGQAVPTRGRGASALGLRLPELVDWNAQHVVIKDVRHSQREQRRPDHVRQEVPTMLFLAGAREAMP